MSVPPETIPPAFRLAARDLPVIAAMVRESTLALLAGDG
jgi:hypothetical protein